MTVWHTAAIAIAGVAGFLVAVLCSAAVAWACPSLLHRLYASYVPDTRRERLLAASGSFFLSFVSIRIVAHSIHAHRGPLHDVVIRGVHIHHLFWGILLLLGIGYLWLLQIGTGESRRASITTAVLFGVGSALTLDEFALWLHLADVYWEPEGRESIDAIILFASLLAAGCTGGALLQGLVREVLRIWRWRMKAEP